MATLPGPLNEKHVGIMGEQSATEDDDEEDDADSLTNIVVDNLVR